MVIVRDSTRKLWYCDIEIRSSTGASIGYYPFIRLALARYQPNSIKESGIDVKLSHIVLSDFAQLTADRSVSITFDPINSKQFTVLISGVYSMRSEDNEFEVIVERQLPGLSGDLDWDKVRDVTISTPAIGTPGVLWFGIVTLPEEKTNGGFRLVIKEYEVFGSDPISGHSGKRLVYADILRIT